jgi:hypothetical protein
MAERSFPFDGGDGAAITEEDWERLAQYWQDSGVVGSPADTSLKVVSLEETGLIYVEAGEAQVRGFHYTNSDRLQLIVPPNTDPVKSRIDVVVVQLDKATNQIRSVYRSGLPATTPVPPTVDTSFDAQEIPLAQILMPAGATTVPNGSPSITDTREFLGQRTRVTNGTGLSYPAGTVFYKPSDDKVYARKAGSVIELGAPVTIPHIPTLDEMLATVPRVRVTGGSVQSGDQYINWGTEDYDIGNMWSTGNPSRIVIPKTGLYAVDILIEWTNSVGSYVAHQVDDFQLGTNTSYQVIESVHWKASQVDHFAPGFHFEYQFYATDSLRFSAYTAASGVGVNPKAVSVRWIAPRST